MKKVKAVAGKMRLLYDDKKEQWTMTGGEWGKHSIYGPAVYNQRIAAHWTGYLQNNGFANITVDNLPKTIAQQVWG